MNNIESLSVSADVIEFINEITTRLSGSDFTDGKPHLLNERNGSYLRSRYGGLTWQLHCSKCGALYDTGDSWD